MRAGRHVSTRFVLQGALKVLLKTAFLEHQKLVIPV